MPLYDSYSILLSEFKRGFARDSFTQLCTFQSKSSQIYFLLLVDLYSLDIVTIASNVNLCQQKLIICSRQSIFCWCFMFHKYKLNFCFPCKYMCTWNSQIGHWKQTKLKHTLKIIEKLFYAFKYGSDQTGYVSNWVVFHSLDSIVCSNLGFNGQCHCPEYCQRLCSPWCVSIVV